MLFGVDGAAPKEKQSWPPGNVANAPPARPGFSEATMHQRTRSEELFNVFNLVLLGLAGLTTLYPFLYTVSLSLSTAA